jgi:ABC-2 type transport system ATP-binding protein
LSDHLIQCRNLRKSFGSIDVLKSVDFSVGSGRLVGFLGPNGAGKTTTIRILMGLLNSTAGEANIFGKPSSSHGKSIRQRVGYLPGDVHLYANLTGRRMLNFFAKARRQDCRDEIERLASVLELELGKRVRKYSTGMKQKLGLIQALMHRPQLLILDEPTSALDPLIRMVVFEELKAVVKEGRTILFSSHSLSEVEELCDEVVIIRDGQIVEQQSVALLRNKAIRKITIKGAAGHELPLELPSPFETIRRDQEEVMGTWSGEINELTKWLATQTVSDLIIEKPDLNDLFLAFYESDESSEKETP